MSQAFAAFNAGSSSIKFSVFQAEHGSLALACHGQIENIDTHPHFVANNREGNLLCEKHIGSDKPYENVLAMMIAWLEDNLRPNKLMAVGHRVVHGGNLFHEPVHVTPEVLKQLEELVPLAPLHQPHSILMMRTLAALHPDLPQVACFDTSFHMSNSRLSRRYALPPEFEQQGIMRYGFHGLSYQHIADELPKLEARAGGKVVVAHLGSGASMCAIKGGKSVASTMGFSTLDGLPMGTRCGALDPGVLFYLLREKHWSLDDLEDLLYHGSGLAGMSGLGTDMRKILASPEQRAREAVELYCYRIARELGSMAAALGGLDVLVFTGGIGEHAKEVRAEVCRQAEWLGVELEVAANEAGAQLISKAGGKVAVWVLPANEEIVIARQAQILHAQGA
ncbi:MAG TPA: acetate/propionate family kinase [Burkholderiaceae bacterium]